MCLLCSDYCFEIINPVSWHTGNVCCSRADQVNYIDEYDACFNEIFNKWKILLFTFVLFGFQHLRYALEKTTW